MKKKTKNEIPISRGEKRWAGVFADNLMAQARCRMTLGDVARLGLPGVFRWQFRKDVASETHNLYQAVFRSGSVTARFWAVANPRKNFDLHSHGFQIVDVHEVVYDFTG